MSNETGLVTTRSVFRFSLLDASFPLSYVWQHKANDCVHVGFRHKGTVQQRPQARDHCHGKSKIKGEEKGGKNGDCQCCRLSYTSIMRDEYRRAVSFDVKDTNVQSFFLHAVYYFSPLLLCRLSRVIRNSMSLVKSNQDSMSLV